MLPLQFTELPPDEMIARAATFYDHIRARRTVRDFSDRLVPRDVIESALLAAGTAPNGANKQPWHFTVIESADVKTRIRVAAEAEEREFYEKRATDEWLADLAPLGTDANKPFLEIAPVLIVCSAQPYTLDGDGKKHKNYYVTESVGIAIGFLIAALHEAGLATLTHTPSPMQFLNEICGRPMYERPLVLLVVGYPAEDATVPTIMKKPLAEIASFI